MADFDGDGLVDIYLVNGSTIDRVAGGLTAPKAAFYRNAGNGTFRDVTDAAGVANERWGQGVCVGDFDNDGREDFYVANFGPNRLYRSHRRRPLRRRRREGRRGGEQLVHGLCIRRL